MEVPDCLPPDDELPLTVDFQAKNDAAVFAPVLLTKHEDRVFEDQFVPMTGHAYFRCRFVRCTFVWDGGPFAAHGCNIENCHVKISTTVMWGVKTSQADFAAICSWVALVTGMRPDPLLGYVVP
jgi:hypothetical protein